MFGFEKKLAQVAESNADKLDEVLKITDPAKRGVKLLEARQDIKSSYRRLSLRSAVEMVAADAFAAVSFLPVTVPFALASMTYSMVGYAFYGFSSNNRLDEIAAAPLDYRRKIVNAKAHKKRDRKTLLDRSNTGLESVISALAPSPFRRDAMLATLLDKHSNKQLSAAFADADREKKTGLCYEQLQKNAQQAPRPGY